MLCRMNGPGWIMAELAATSASRRVKIFASLRGLTLGRLATVVGLDARRLRALLSGAGELPDTVVARLARALDVDASLIARNRVDPAIACARWATHRDYGAAGRDAGIDARLVCDRLTIVLDDPADGVEAVVESSFLGPGARPLDPVGRYRRGSSGTRAPARTPRCSSRSRRPAFFTASTRSTTSPTRQTVVSGFNDALRALDWDALGVRRFTSHGIRRMVLDLYYEAGVDVGTVAAQLGQSPQVALKYYRQATQGQRTRAVALAGLGERGAPNVVPLRREGTS